MKHDVAGRAARGPLFIERTSRRRVRGIRLESLSLFQDMLGSERVTESRNHAV